MHDSSQIGRGNLRVQFKSASRMSPSDGLLILAVGILCQVVDSPFNACHAVEAEVHAVFGVLLCAAVFARFCRDPRLTAFAAPRDITGIARTLSRRIYLLMYVLFGLRMALSSGLPQPLPVEGFRDYLMCGILAIVVVRVLAARRLRVAGFTPLASRPRIDSP